MNRGRQKAKAELTLPLTLIATKSTIVSKMSCIHIKLAFTTNSTTAGRTEPVTIRNALTMKMNVRTRILKRERREC